MGRKIGIDFGKTRIGLAVESPVGTLALPLQIISYHSDLAFTARSLLKAIENLSDIEGFVIGLPLMMNGKESPLSLEVREFAKKLEEISSKSVTFWDERLTSKQADQMLRETNMKRKKRDAISDKIAATLILQSYLDSLPK